MESLTIAVVGLGYVGLPLVVEFGKLGRTIGFDIDESKVARCRQGQDPSREIPDEEMCAAVHAEYSADPACLREADVVLVAVPTPVDAAHIPDLGPLVGASRVIASSLSLRAAAISGGTRRRRAKKSRFSSTDRSAYRFCPSPCGISPSRALTISPSASLSSDWPNTATPVEGSRRWAWA